jgi:chemotaxis protein methyltransferase CheR
VSCLDAEVNDTASAAPHIDSELLFDIEQRALLEAIYLRWQHDFRQYAPASMRRRLRQAMAALGCTRLSQLQDRVLRDGEAFDRLLQYLTVQVSEMFRDPAYFRALREQVVPELRTYPSLKLWVAGCSNGEEVWSLAILLHEEGLLERCIVYATDINPQALARAEAGVFDRDSMPVFSRNYLAAGGRASLGEYCTAAYGGVLFDRKLKRQVVFADHSLATDAVFSEVHLVSCRNVLIYFDAPLQTRAIGLFRDALVRHGFLGLGSRESLRFSAHASAFEPFHPQADVRIYRRY